MRDVIRTWERLPVKHAKRHEIPEAANRGASLVRLVRVPGIHGHIVVGPTGTLSGALSGVHARIHVSTGRIEFVEDALQALAFGGGGFVLRCRAE